jgi:hypothetical protein
MTEDQSATIIRQLATLAESTASLRRDFDIERQDSHLSRKELHEKVNGVAEDVAAVKGDVKVAGMVAAQARDAASELKAAVEKAAPTLADVEQAKKLGAVLLWLIGGGALAIIGAAVAYGEAFKSWLSHWLGIR